MQLTRLIIVGLAAMGVLVALLALREHYRTDTSPCSINERWDCGVVNQSPYATIAGVPVAAIGMAGYLLIGLFAIRRRFALLLAAAASGLAFSLYLTYIEARVLHVWCIYCVGSLALIVFICAAALVLALQRGTSATTTPVGTGETQTEFPRHMPIWVWATLSVFAVVVLLAFRLAEYGLSARNEPSASERLLAQAARRWSIPVKARKLQNPLPASPELIARGREHWADHCANCHGNDGKGDTEIGRNLYPRAPDMRAPATQSRTDGDLYYIIRNGVPWTGMPAWGSTELGDFDSDSWTLVLFIRHLPSLTPDEIQEMESLNPKGPMERQEEQEEDDFLNGKPAKEIQHVH